LRQGIEAPQKGACLREASGSTYDSKASRADKPGAYPVNCKWMIINKGDLDHGLTPASGICRVTRVPALGSVSRSSLSMLSLPAMVILPHV